MSSALSYKVQFWRFDEEQLVEMLWEVAERRAVMDPLIQAEFFEPYKSVVTAEQAEEAKNAMICGYLREIAEQKFGDDVPWKR